MFELTNARLEGVFSNRCQYVSIRVNTLSCPASWWVHQIYGKSEFCCAASDELETTTKLSTKTHATHLKYTQCVSTTSFPKDGTLIAFAPVKYPAAILLALCTSPNMFPVTTRIIFTHSEPSNVLHDICRNLSAPQGASHNCAYKKCLWSSRCKTHFMPQRQMKKTVLPTPSHGRSYPRICYKDLHGQRFDERHPLNPDISWWSKQRSYGSDSKRKAWAYLAKADNSWHICHILLWS